jgi:hypothetical protein
MKSILMLEKPVTRIPNNPNVCWSPVPLESSPMRGVVYGLLLSLPLWALFLAVLYWFL